ncbi:MAG: hypothetical protein KC731_30410, partial [Myxococcales bacterium]|nr:hypothetical protein [Myxococcales bacterium]
REALPREAPPRGAPRVFTSPPRPSPWLRFGVEVALGAVGSPGGVGPTMHLLAAVTWRPLDIGGLRIFVAPALTTTTLNEPEGAASLRPGLLGGEVVLLPLGEEAPIGPSFAAGASATWLTVSGTEAADDLVTKATTTWGFSPHARAGLVVAPLPRLRLHLDGLAGVLARRVVVSFADRAAATWGRPILGATAGVEVVLR